MKKLNERKRSKEAVQGALQVKFVFDEEEHANDDQWRYKLYEDMTQEEQDQAQNLAGGASLRA